MYLEVTTVNSKPKLFADEHTKLELNMRRRISEKEQLQLTISKTKIAKIN